MQRASAFLSVGLAACASPPPADCPPAPTAVAAPATQRAKTETRPRPEQAQSEQAQSEQAEAEAHHHGSPHRGAGPHGPLVRRFDNADDWVDHFEGAERDAWQKPAEVVKAMALAQGMTVADIGAGTGYFLPHLSRAVGGRGRVIAIDIEPAMVEHMLERVRTENLDNTHPQLAAVDNPMLRDESVDRILIVDTWHHIPERNAYAEKLAAALAPGGSLFVVDFTQDTERGPPKNHRVKPSEVVATLKDAGLTTRLEAEVLPDQFIAIGSKPKR